MRIRPEQPEDIDAIREVTTAAFALAAHSSGTEATIVDALRNTSALTISLVAIIDEELVGHIAISPIPSTATTATGTASAPSRFAPATSARA